jgi:hypothetical protein
MVSERKVASNRSNARMSTGPRTPNGKARASQNARKHGFSIPLRQSTEASQDIERLAQLFAGEKPDDQRLALARTAAEAGLEIVRVRRHKTTLIDTVLAPNLKSDRPGPVHDRLRHWNAALEAEIFSKLFERLRTLDRYERRAFSRRKKALRALAELP